MKFNPEQLKIAKAYLAGGQNMAIKSSAGCGKTTLIIGLAKLCKTPRNFAIFAYNKSTVETLQQRLPELSGCAMTTYSAGMKALSGHLQKTIGDPDWVPVVNSYKYEGLIREFITYPWNEALYLRHSQTRYPENDTFLKESIQGHLGICLLNLWLTMEEIQDYLSENWDIPMIGREWVSQIIFDSIQKGESLLKKTGEMSFHDMVVYPVVWGVECTKYSTIFVDEAQDLSVAQRAFIGMSLADGGQLVIVGDPRQAIYHFSGSDLHSFSNFQVEFKCKLYKLSLNYRSGTKILKYARELDPDIKAIKGAPKGDVYYLPRESAIKHIAETTEDTLVIGRTHYALVNLAINLIYAGVDFQYDKGVIDRKMMSLVRWHMSDDSGMSLEDWANSLIDHVSNQTNDLLDCVLEFSRISGKTGNSLVHHIQRFFRAISDSASVTLSTIHSAKGKEENTVIYWGCNQVPHPNAKSVEEIAAEWNLEYVARTRAKKTLILVEL